MTRDAHDLGMPLIVGDAAVSAVARKAKLRASRKTYAEAMRIPTLALALAVLALGACAPLRRVAPTAPGRDAARPPASPVARGILHEDVATVTATVQEIETETHRITLVRSDGTQLAVVAPDNALFTTVLADDIGGDEFEKGDEVTVTYRESAAFEVKKPNQAKPGSTQTRDVMHAPRGEKPAGSVTSIIEVRASITAIDEAASTVTIRDDQGNVAVMSMPDSSALRAIAVGDVMDITYTVALAIAVRKPGPQPG